jgi:hypothetical protein
VARAVERLLKWGDLHEVRSRSSDEHDGLQLFCSDTAWSMVRVVARLARVARVAPMQCENSTFRAESQPLAPLERSLAWCTNAAQFAPGALPTGTARGRSQSHTWAQTSTRMVCQASL